MRNHALQFVPVEPRGRAAGDADDRVAGSEPGREGIDAFLLIHQVHGRRRCARRNRHLFDDVEQSLLDRVGDIGREQPATQVFGHHPAPRAQLRDLVQAAAADND